jgi:hypothetical protein
MGELVATPTRKFRGSIPREHQVSLDTRIKWLWHQRFGTVQTIWNTSRDVLDHTACTLILQAIMAKDLESISQLFTRIEGGALEDVEVQERAQKVMRL